MAAANGGEIRARLTLENGDFRRRMYEARNEVTGFATHTSKIMRVNGNTMLTAMGAGALAVGTAVTMTAATFEQSMSKVAAISGATNEQFKALEQAALDAGANTAYSASQAADALSFLAMAGFTTEQQIATLPNMLDLAAASGADLAQSADIASNMMTGFGIAAEESGRMADVLVKTTTTANTDLLQLGDAMKYVAPVANGLGISFEETAAAVGIMSNAGIQGSMAGTALRAALLQLASPAGQAEKAMEELGIQTMNADGNMKPLPELIGHIASKMEGMTDAQKTSTAAQLVGTEAASGFVTLLEAGEEGLQAYTTKLENSGGTAEKVADKMKDNLIGSFDEFTSAVEGAAIGVGKEFLPAAKGVVDLGTELVRVFSGINPQVGAAVIQFAALAGGITVAQKAMKVFSAITMSTFLTKGNLWAMGIAGVTAGLSYYVTEQTKANELSSEATGKTVETIVQTEKLADRYEALRNKMTGPIDLLGEYMDLQDQLDGAKTEAETARVTKAMEDLAKKSGLSTKELGEMVDLSGKIQEVVPNTETSVSELGNQFATSTEQIREFNEQQRVTLENQMAKELSKIDSQLTGSAERRKEILGEINQEIDSANTKRIAAEGYEYKINELQKQHKQALEEGNKKLADRLQFEIDSKQQVADKYREEAIYHEEEANRQKERYTKEQLNLLKKQEILQNLRDQNLQAVGINEKGELGIKQLDQQIKKHNDIIGKLKEKVKSGGTLNDQEKKTLAASQEQVKKLQSAKNEVDNLNDKLQKTEKNVKDAKKESEGMSRVLSKSEVKNVKFSGNPLDTAVKISNESRRSVSKHVKLDDKGRITAMNEDLQRPVTKSITLKIKQFGEWIGDKVSGFLGKRHNGGTVHQLPKFHGGGLADNPNNPNRPRFDEVDVRLLRNEMVLTKGQQANLFNMIRTFNAAKAEGVGQGGNGRVIQNTFSFGQVVVREEADIEKIARKLDEMAKYEARAGGRYY